MSNRKTGGDEGLLFRVLRVFGGWFAVVVVERVGVFYVGECGCGCVKVQKEFVELLWLITMGSLGTRGAAAPLDPPLFLFLGGTLRK